MGEGSAGRAWRSTQRSATKGGIGYGGETAHASYSRPNTHPHRSLHSHAKQMNRRQGCGTVWCATCNVPAASTGRSSSLAPPDPTSPGPALPPADALPRRHRPLGQAARPVVTRQQPPGRLSARVRHPAARHPPPFHPRVRARGESYVPGAPGVEAAPPRPLGWEAGVATALRRGVAGAGGAAAVWAGDRTAQTPHTRAGSST